MAFGKQGFLKELLTVNVVIVSYKQRMQMEVDLFSNNFEGEGFFFLADKLTSQFHPLTFLVVLAFH